jgi:hypothetical protein
MQENEADREARLREIASDPALGAFPVAGKTISGVYDRHGMFS